MVVPWRWRPRKCACEVVVVAEALLLLVGVGVKKRAVALMGPLWAMRIGKRLGVTFCGEGFDVGLETEGWIESILGLYRAAVWQRCGGYMLYRDGRRGRVDAPQVKTRSVVHGRACSSRNAWALHTVHMICCTIVVPTREPNQPSPPR